MYEIKVIARLNNFSKVLSKCKPTENYSSSQRCYFRAFIFIKICKP